MKRPPKEVPPPSQYKRGEPRLRELLDVFALFTEERGGFPMVLTRVPCVGEHIARESDIYRVVHVEHQMLDNHGWNAFGSHAIVDVVRVPNEPRPKRNRKSAR